mgnify:FL=1
MIQFEKQYIVQAISLSANSLRLNNDKIEVVTLLKQFIMQSTDLAYDMSIMKRITETSRLAIRIADIHTALSTGRIDFNTLSEKFKDHCRFLVSDLSLFLDSVSPASFNVILERVQKSVLPESLKDLPIETISKTDVQDEAVKPKELEKNVEQLKEEFIMDGVEDDDDDFFSDVERNVLQPIKEIDALLLRLTEGESPGKDILFFAKILKKNGERLERFHTSILPSMHYTLHDAFHYIYEGKLTPSLMVTESMRACLIVIVATIRNKEVDINTYFNKAEAFTNLIKSME